ncbi:MAG: RNA pseudouridine synthase [Flavobacteriia bacterium]|nr:MAG: RNA pseudouridine synthase [Flavobacteriia bacterium]
MASTLNTLEILYEDNHVIVVNKKAGDLVQNDKTGDRSLRELVMQYIKDKYNKPGNVYLGVVHRLDRPTTGVVLFAKTSKALTRLNAIFKAKEAKKTYWAIVNGKTREDSGTLKHYMVRNRKQNKSTAHKKPLPDAKEAVLHYKVLKVFDKYTLLEINLETGRHHQIRAQMKAIGHYIKGDLKYGSPRSNADAGIHLHARRLQVKHPVKDTVLDITAPVPDDVLWQLCE